MVMEKHKHHGERRRDKDNQKVLSSSSDTSAYPENMRSREQQVEAMEKRASKSTPRKRTRPSLFLSEPRKRGGRPPKQKPESPKSSRSVEERSSGKTSNGIGNADVERVEAELEVVEFSVVEKSSQAPMEDGQNVGVDACNRRTGEQDNPGSPISASQAATKDQIMEEDDPIPICIVTDDQNLPLRIKEARAVPGFGSQNFPFVKYSMVWQFFESMEVFERLPQSPHYRPLEACDENIREGLAVAKTVQFTNLIEDISSLDGSESAESVNQMMRDLAGFEEWGFDVGGVLARLEEWLSVLAKAEELEAESTRVENETRLGDDQAEITEVEDAELDGELKGLEETRAALVARIAERGEELGDLEANAVLLDEVIWSKERSFKPLF